MHTKHNLAAVSLVLSATAFNAQAALTSYIGAGNVGLVYSSFSDVTWTQDANLFKTLYDADNTLISRIADVTPTYSDPVHGLQTIDATDFNVENGRMSWWGAIAWTRYLNNVQYGGSSQWGLPISNAVVNNGQVNYIGLEGNELGQLFYDELAGTFLNSIPDTTYFNNEQSYYYWTGTEFPLNNDNNGWAFVFRTDIGHQNFGWKPFLLHAWAMSPGQVPAVPVPGAFWLMGSGLCLLGRRFGTGAARVVACND
jgi:hypothetical protein